MVNVALPEQARAVVIGAGIAGCSVAYHLTKLGWRDIVVLDQGTLFETGGSTSHAPGLVFQVNPSKTMATFARYTVDLWKSMELDGERCANPVGSLEVAWTPERLEDLKRKAGFAMSWGIEAHVISPGEARDMIPMLSDRILGALHVPSDIHTRATRPAEAMAREAERNGATFYGDVKVTGLGIENGRIDAVPHYTGRHPDRTGRLRRRNLGAACRRNGGRLDTAVSDAAPLRCYRAAQGTRGRGGGSVSAHPAPPG